MPQPPRFHDALGRLTYDGRLGSYTTRLPIGDHRVEVLIDADDADLGAAVERTAALAPRLETVVEAAAAFAASMLLGIKNDTWREDGEALLSSVDFEGRLSLEGVTVSSDGDTLYFEDGDLFWGHTVVVSRDAAGAFVEASIAG